MNQFKKAKVRCPAQACDVTLAEVMAVKALNTGSANEHQQRLALRWITHVAAAMQVEPYFPNSERDTAFMLGRQHVGRQILSVIQQDVQPKE